MGYDPLTGILTGVTAGAGLIEGQSANKASKEMMRRQAQLIQKQGQTYGQAQQYYQPLLQQYANQAGLGGDLQQVGEGHFASNPSRAGFGLGGHYGSYEDQLRLKGAQSDIAHHTMAGANQLRHQLGGMGIADASIGAALARNQQAGDQQFGQFRRGLAINAQAEQERRLQVLQNALQLGFGQGGQASAGYGQQAGVYGNQANQAYAGVGNALQNYGYMRGLGGYGQQGGYGSEGDTPVTYGVSPGYGPNTIQGPGLPGGYRGPWANNDYIRLGG